MCLGFPGRVRSMDADSDVAAVDVDGVTRQVNIALVRDDGVQVGDWVLIHLGFAMEVIDEAEANRAMDGLRLLGDQLDHEVARLGESGSA